jgi:hypothetical protein
LKDSLILRSDKKQPEFELIEALDNESITIDALMPTALNFTIQNHKQVAEILQEIASKLDRTQINHYFRAGRAYFTISHEMGNAGNLFFKSVFDNLLQGTKGKSHSMLNQNTFCIIFRL